MIEALINIIVFFTFLWFMFALMALIPGVMVLSVLAQDDYHDDSLTKRYLKQNVELSFAFMFLPIVAIYWTAKYGKQTVRNIIKNSIALWAEYLEEYQIQDNNE